MPLNDELQQQLIKDLLIESTEGLDRFDREMLVLEKGQGTPETLNVIFRVIHTIKGTAGCLGLPKIESVAHVGENLLDSLREGKLTSTPEMITTLLAYADALRAMLESLETTGNEGSADYSILLQQLQDFLTGKPVATPPAPAPAAKQTWGLFDDEPAATAPASPASESTAPPAPSAPPPVLMENTGVEKEVATRSHSASDSAIRVDVGQLDKLMNLVGELVLARNQIVQFTNQAQDPTFLNASQRLNNITTELQEGVMKTRMQPIGNIWAKFPRVVRDVSLELGKSVQLVMEGKETDLDRTIIEAIKDPLTHIVRNAIDHGIEMPNVRRAAGKPDEGMLILRAFHEGGQVNIEIMDDGHGINIARVKQKAVEKGLITPENAARMSDRESFNLIFLPGFSTAEKITNVSGRGVGMDVVKTNIEKIGGSVDVQSEAGKGSTIKIKIPLTLAIIPA
ncbi:MAG: chemotaxis protein CheA, partial [Opitutaceae bacterium]|nr:chemotaxis protein CheA [Opitutaceae bacterium]